jgi:pyruvate, water dikinase
LIDCTMGVFSSLFSKLSFKGRKEKLSPTNVEELRTAFKARYHNFKVLLAANNKALEIMAEMEEALRGNRPFGMSFVRANCTAVSVNVFRIIKNLDLLAPGKYGDLYERFKDIQERINQALSQKRQLKAEKLVFPFEKIDMTMADQVGSKMANLGEVINRLDLPVPPGFVVSSLAYQRFFEYNDLQTEIDRRLQASEVDQLDQLYSLSADIQQLIIRAALPPDLEQAILDAYRELESKTGKEVKTSMRSSALGEDLAGTSFAGQYRSELNVSSDDILEAYKEIVASKYSLQAIAYRLNRGILDEDVAMCVGCMVMVNAASGGVTYSRNPLNIRDDSITINSVWGLPKSVVDGSVVADLFVVSREEPMRIVQQEIKAKEQKFVCYPEEGVCRLDVTGDQSNDPSLSEDQILKLTRIALRLEDYYGTPQDVEWAIDQKGSIFVLQCRPLKQMEGGDGGPRTVRDDSPRDDVILQGGITASSGVACGPVYLLLKHGDSLQFPHGAVLVTAQALPRWAALLNRAAAVVTEQGSAAGHLANVAREFGVPAVFGVPSATGVLQNDELVTIDADGLAIYRGRVESLLIKHGEVKKNLMEGSPVYEILKEVADHIVPLHLLDPDASDFKPKKCRTLHDITRFCHEKSVKEMFSFGKEHHFSERASKQLVCDVPMLWWIINLDDGFKEDVPGKYVPLDNIVSIPMLALWEGIIAIPWEGPPPVDTKGFMSVLLEASANPGLDPSMPSVYVNRNYFMISKNFCSLTSRFGFHFCTIETLVSERPGENYISFSFKGGAADYHRRLRRAVFVSGILEEYGFRAELKEDGVFARIEGFDETVMKEKLKILGYLLIHTRQLDMIMSNDSAYNHHRNKIASDIHSIIDMAPMAASN